MLNNSVTILGQIITFLLGLFSTYIIFDFMSKFERNLYYKKHFYVIAYGVCQEFCVNFHKNFRIKLFKNN
ncbi:hypothetical protein [Clostridium brassicae]|uniref:Uncharacterized protein n=1 Tax=Clostridium brassicae TaxID=2999072 RepID=A0ABT4DCW3_9CLOT|nr:hypothetical protein [Clostridium brassicae]MCY6960137.1 hypothetical protein [Clostridium brassicae]